MNTELLEALNILEQEKDISKETLMDAIENSLISACKNHFGKADNIKVIMDRKTCDYSLFHGIIPLISSGFHGRQCQLHQRKDDGSVL